MGNITQPTAPVRGIRTIDSKIEERAQTVKGTGFPSQPQRPRGGSGTATKARAAAVGRRTYEEWESLDVEKEMERVDEHVEEEKPGHGEFLEDAINKVEKSPEHTPACKHTLWVSLSLLPVSLSLSLSLSLSSLCSRLFHLHWQWACLPKWTFWRTVSATRATNALKPMNTRKPLR